MFYKIVKFTISSTGFCRVSKMTRSKLDTMQYSEIMHHQISGDHLIFGRPCQFSMLEMVQVSGDHVVLVDGEGADFGRPCHF